MSNLVLYAIPAFLVSILLELVWARRHARDASIAGYEVRDTFASLGMGLGNVFVSAVTGLVTLAALAGLYQYRIVTLAGHWWAWIVLLFAEDLCYYAFHRAHHEVRFLWAAHVNHHSSQRYNLSTALRQSWTTPLTGPIFWMPLACSASRRSWCSPRRAGACSTSSCSTPRASRRLGPLEWIFNTPSHHRVHHGANVEYLDRNHAGIFILWDRMFGTFEPERAPVVYGLTTNIHTYNPARIAFHEFAALGRDVRRARSARDALGYVLRPPGWSPDGSTLTARQLQARRATA